VRRAPIDAIDKAEQRRRELRNPAHPQGALRMDLRGRRSETMLYTSDQLRPWHELNRSAFNLFHFCSIRSPFALAASALRAKDRKEGTSQQTERGNGREKEAQRAG